MKQRNDFVKRLLALVLPIAFQQFMLAVVSASDAVMLGAFSQDSMSAVSLAGQVQFVFNLFLAAMTIGTSMLAAQYWGKGNKTAVEHIFAFVVRLSFPVSLAVTLCAAVFPSVLMRLLTPETVLITFGAQYLRAVSLSYLLCGISQIYLCIMKNSGRVFLSSAISSVCVLMNILLNAIFIFGLFGMPVLGIKGAAIATVIARAVELLWGMLASIGKDKIKLRIRMLLHPEKQIVRDFWKYTTPVLGNELVWGIGFTMGTVIMGHLGKDAVAANSIANIAKNLAVCFCMGLGSGAGIMVGNELGAGNLDTARLYGKKLCRTAVISGVVTGGVLLCVSPFICHFAHLTQTATEYLKWMLVVCSVNLVGKSVNIATISGIFCAGGDSKFGFLCDTITLWCIIVPLGLLAAFVFELPVLTVYIIINLDELLKLLPVWKHYKRYKWVKDLTRKEKTQ